MDCDEENELCFYRLAREGETDEALHLLRDNPRIARMQCAFFQSARRYSGRIVELMIELGADVNQVDQLGCPALYFAILHGNLDALKVLLEHGADPNIKTSIANVVDSSPVPNRKEMFKLMLEYGADINQAMSSSPGYNLYVFALEYKDDEMLELIKANGGRPTQMYLDALEAEPVTLDLETFEERLVNSLRECWTTVRESRQKETFYLFGIQTDDDVALLTPFCNTEEQVRKDFLEELTDFPVVKWHVGPDSELYGFGQEFTEVLSLELNSIHSADETVAGAKKRKKRILEIFENALITLDDEGFFGAGEERDKLLLSVDIMDADAKTENAMLRIAKRINPPKSLKPLLDELKLQGRSR